MAAHKEEYVFLIYFFFPSSVCAGETVLPSSRNFYLQPESVISSLEEKICALSWRKKVDARKKLFEEIKWESVLNVNVLKYINV